MRRSIGPMSAVALLSSILGACAGASDKYPSLAIRDAERVSGQFEPVSSVEPVELPIRSLAPDTSISALVQQANTTHQTFAARVSSARPLAARASGAGRDSDVRGQAIVALSDLSSLRSQTEIALADLDLLIAERTNRLQSADDALVAHAQVLALVQEQDRTLTALWSILGR